MLFVIMNDFINVREDSGSLKKCSCRGCDKRVYERTVRRCDVESARSGEIYMTVALCSRHVHVTKEDNVGRRWHKQIDEGEKRCRQ